MLLPVDKEAYDYRKLYRDLDVAKSRVFMGKDAAFFAPIMCAMDFVWSEGIPTAATDAVTFWWNPKYFMNSDLNIRVSSIMHELWHVVLLHMLRRGNRDPEDWNKSCDIKINRMLRKAGYYVSPTWLDYPNLDHIEAEEDIYDVIHQHNMDVGHGHCSHDHEDIDPQDPSVITDMVVKGVTNAKMEGKPDSIPGGVEELVNSFLAPVIPWEMHLQQWMSDLQDFDYSWNRPNRRYPEMYLPSSVEDEGRLEHLVYFQDVSGSITNQEIKRFNSELKYVWDEFKPQKMTIIQFDTIIQKIDQFHEGDEFAEIKIKGRGGTSLRCVREKIIELKPTAAVIFSDMQVAPMEPLPFEIPILWAATNAVGATVPFGKLVHVKV